MTRLLRWDGTTRLWLPIDRVPAGYEISDPAKTTPSVTLDATPEPAAVGATVTVAVTVTPAAAPAPVVKQGATTVTMSGSSGSYTGTFSMPNVSSVTVSAYTPSNATYNQSATKTDAVAKATTVTKTWSGYATETRSYEDDGSLRYEYSTSRCYHGYYSSTNGRQTSALWFSVPSDVAGSSVTAASLRLTRIGGLGDSNPQTAIGTHKSNGVHADYDDIPSVNENHQSWDGPNYSSSDVTATVTLNSTMRTSFQNGAKGIVLGRSDASIDYQAFRGESGVATSELPRLSLTYVVG